MTMYKPESKSWYISKSKSELVRKICYDNDSIFYSLYVMNSYFWSRYVAEPAKVLGELLASGDAMPVEVEGEILAGDPAELNVLKME